MAMAIQRLYSYANKDLVIEVVLILKDMHMATEWRVLCSTDTVAIILIETFKGQKDSKAIMSCS